MDKIEEQRQKIEKQMEKKKKEKITCYIPIAQLYCFFADLYGQLASLDDQLAEATRRWKHVNGELLSARNRLVQLREDQQTLATNQAQTKHSIEQLGNELVALHATLGAYRKTSQAHHEVLVGFVAQMDEFNALPPSQRPEVIERRLVRLRDQLVAEMGHACQLMKSAGPALPGNVQQACAKKS
jgi:chromosome segregation ATPase